MKEPRMLYKFPGTTINLQDGGYDYIIVDECDKEATLDDGWFLTPADAKQAHEKPVKEPKKPKQAVVED